MSWIHIDKWYKKHTDPAAAKVQSNSFNCWFAVISDWLTLQLGCAEFHAP